MEQIKGRGYAEKHLGEAGVHLIAMVFGSGERNLLDLRAESVPVLSAPRSDADDRVWRRLRNVVAWR